MNKKTLFKIAQSAILLTPALTYAATIETVLGTIVNILNFIIPILMIVATVVLLWGVISYVIAGGDEEKLNTAKQFIMLGLIGLFVMVAVWGIVKALVSTFAVGGTGIPAGPGATF